MRLPVILPDVKNQHFDCHSCTNCCRDLVVHITPADRDKIDRQDWSGKIEGQPYVLLGRSYVLNHKAGGGCAFLHDDGRCRIHAEHGAAEKPLACQLYPFTLESEGSNIRIGIRLDCPSAARNEGKPISEHKREIGRIAFDLKKALPAEFAAGSPAEIVRGRPLSAGEVDSVVEHIDAWLRDAGRPIGDRLIGLCNLVNTLGEAKLINLRSEQLRELVGILTADLPNAVQAHHEQPPPAPAKRQLKLFRQAIFAHCESITLTQAQAPFIQSLKYRLNQLARARQLASGSGAIPPLFRESPLLPPLPRRERVGVRVESSAPGACIRNGEPSDDVVVMRNINPGDSVTFAQLDSVTPDPALDALACEDLLTRFLRAKLLGRAAFGKGYYGWPVLQGLAALLLTMPITGWLVRYVAMAAGRSTYTQDDIVRAIGIVDRHAGRVPELGSRPAAMRLRYLINDHGLLRLILAYPIAPERPPETALNEQPQPTPVDREPPPEPTDGDEQMLPE